MPDSRRDYAKLSETQNKAFRQWSSWVQSEPEIICTVFDANGDAKRGGLPKTRTNREANIRQIFPRRAMGFTHNNHQRPLLITFCGLPGSGKTTIAKEVEKTTGAVRLNTDEWVAALGVDFFDDAFRAKLQVRLYEHGLTLLQLGQSIIVEDGLWRRDERDRYREVAHQLGAAIAIHYFDVPFDELWRRLEARNALGAYGTVPITKDLLKACWRRFQRPDEAELALFDSYVVYR